MRGRREGSRAEDDGINNNSKFLIRRFDPQMAAVIAVVVGGYERQTNERPAGNPERSKESW